MASSSPSVPSSLPRQLMRWYLSSRLGAALLQRPSPAASTDLPAAAAYGHRGQAEHGDGGGADASVPRSVVAELRAVRGGAPRPKGRPTEPREGSGGEVHAAPTPASLTTAAKLGRRPTPPGPPAEGAGGGGGKIHAAPTPAALTAPKLGRRPTPPGPPAEGAGGRGGAVHAAAS
ncbi:hypothetical protein ACP70R_003410 [Stipagrostis hirtigluma subsp. patula]